MFEWNDFLTKRMPVKKPSNSFTMIELLVVIGVIGILASLLLPALSRAKRKAMVVVCINNVSQQSKMLQLFAGDYEDMTTMQYGTAEPRNSSYYIVKNVDKHHNFGNMWRAGLLNDTRILMCPSGKPGEPWDPALSGITMATHYSVRPETNHSNYTPDLPLSSNLVGMSNYSDLAILSEGLYRRYGNNKKWRYHENGNTTGYGDGSARYVIANTMPYWYKVYIDKSTGFYKTEGESYPSSTGIWYQLDQTY